LKQASLQGSGASLDEQRLTQVLLNLVGNAIKFTDGGEVCITATASNGYFALSVTDTEPGIPQQHQARILEQFHQVDSSNTKTKGGTGLGLAIGRGLATPSETSHLCRASIRPRCGRRASP